MSLLQSQNILKELANKAVKVEVQGAREVPWFPKEISDIDYFVVKVTCSLLDGYVVLAYGSMLYSVIMSVCLC